MTSQAGAEVIAGVVPEGYKVLKEGQAQVLLRGNDVFYNEAQVTNRDLSTAVLRQFLPILAQEHKDGKYKKQRLQRQQQRKVVNAGQQQANQQQPAAVDDATEAGEAPKDEQEQQAGTEEGIKEETANGENQPSTSGRPANEAPRGAIVLEGLAASGLRSIRYALEVPGIKRIDANDLDAAVCDSMRRNMAFNGPPVSNTVRVLHSDARLTMMKAPLEYDVIDLDPYGTPAQLLDSAVQSVADGGLLLITATDMANLCGNNSVACWSNYGIYPLHRSYCHEQALRILLACIESHANRYKRYIQPLLSVSVDFYVRVFVRVFTSAAIVKDSACRMSYVWQSSGCDSYWLQPVGQKKVNGNAVKYMPAHGPAVPDMKCPDSGSNYIMGGPIWGAPIHDQEFVQSVIDAMDKDKARYAQYTRIRGLLQSAVEELPDAPLYYNLHDLCKTVRLTPLKHEVFKSAIINAGYKVSGAHTNPLAVKTDAPPSVIWDILRCWIKDHPVNVKDPNSYAAKILAKEPTITANFARASAAVKKQTGPRFVENPAYWGPKSRHGRPPVHKPDTANAAGTSSEAAPAAADDTVNAKEEAGEAQPMDTEENNKANGAVVEVEGQEAKRQRVE